MKNVVSITRTMTKMNPTKQCKAFTLTEMQLCVVDVMKLMRQGGAEDICFKVCTSKKEQDEQATLQT
jgi:hypothetical protein